MRQLTNFMEVPNQIRGFLLVVSLLTTFGAFSQMVTVLPQNNSYSSNVAPQGALRFQRHFYLITPAEMSVSSLPVDSLINRIGFTLAAAQGDSSRGNFQVYLENTMDLKSRLDTTWTDSTSMTNSIEISNLIQGEYEWRVQTICTAGADSSTHSVTNEFVTVDTSDCNRPQNLETLNIGPAAATFSWSSPYSSGFTEYEVQYRISSAMSWTSTSTSDTFYNATNLTADTSYQWRVSTVCSGGSSSSSATFFSTQPPDVCNEASGLTNGTLTDTSAALSWTAAVGASYYSLEYRRFGTDAWFSNLSFANSSVVNGLSPGTTYEWRVRTSCSMGEGSFVSGTNFTTTGTTICYAPVGLEANVKSDTNVILSWNTVPGANSYKISFRPKNSISWDSAVVSMVLVHNDSIDIPDTIGALDIPFSGMMTSPFIYSGDGLYIAWEYTGKSGPLTSFSSALATSVNYNIKDQNGQDSIVHVLSLATRSDTAATAHQDVLLATKLRPATRLGAKGLQDSVEVVAVHAQGYHAIGYQDTARISAVIRNHAAKIKSYTVSLLIKDQASGQIRYTADSLVMIEADATALIHFDGWVPTSYETDSVIVSIAADGTENVLENNRNFFIQKLNNSTIAYADQTEALTSTGFGAGSGLILARYEINGCGSVNAASIYLDQSCKDKEIYAVLMNSSGMILDSSKVEILDSSKLNSYHTFYFPKTPFFDSSEFYVGLAQMVHSTPFYPVRVQWETTEIRDSAYYRAAIDGTGLVNQPYPGRLMIKAEMVPGRTVPNIRGDASLCLNDSDTLKVGSKTITYANEVVSVSSEFSNVNYSATQALGSPNIYPNHNFDAKQWIGSTTDSQREFIILRFPDPGPINYIDIYETLNVGAVDTVYVKNPGTGNFEVVYMDTAMLGDTFARINHISFDTTTFDVSEIRIAVASDSIQGYNGIDAVAIGLESDTSDFESYTWSTNETSASIIVTSAGTYTVTVTDALGCQFSDSLTITTPSQVAPAISISGSMASDTSFCQGGQVILKIG